jgi:nanoRNase/pAp phosphatase (c-di-AMP/oligoRNAs hydrolase)
MTSKKYLGALVNNDISNANDLGVYILNILKKYDFCIIFNIQKDLTVHCGIRSKYTFNSLDIAEKYQGGGHVISAGFCLTINELMRILNDKIIYIQ